MSSEPLSDEELKHITDGIMAGFYRNHLGHNARRELMPLLAEVDRLKALLAGFAVDAKNRQAMLLHAGQACVDWFEDHDGEDCHFCTPRDGKHDEDCPLTASPTTETPGEGPRVQQVNLPGGGLAFFETPGEPPEGKPVDEQVCGCPPEVCQHVPDDGRITMRVTREQYELLLQHGATEGGGPTLEEVQRQLRGLPSLIEAEAKSAAVKSMELGKLMDTGTSSYWNGVESGLQGAAEIVRIFAKHYAPVPPVPSSPPSGVDHAPTPVPASPPTFACHREGELCPTPIKCSGWKSCQAPVPASVTPPTKRCACPHGDEPCERDAEPGEVLCDPCGMNCGGALPGEGGGEPSVPGPTSSPAEQKGKP